MGELDLLLLLRSLSYSEEVNVPTEWSLELLWQVLSPRPFVSLEARLMKSKLLLVNTVTISVS